MQAASLCHAQVCRRMCNTSTPGALVHSADHCCCCCCHYCHDCCHYCRCDDSSNARYYRATGKPAAAQSQTAQCCCCMTLHCCCSSCSKAQSTTHPPGPCWRRSMKNGHRHLAAAAAEQHMRQSVSRGQDELCWQPIIWIGARYLAMVAALSSGAAAVLASAPAAPVRYQASLAG
jgi:hypothetical protein